MGAGIFCHWGWTIFCAAHGTRTLYGGRGLYYSADPAFDILAVFPDASLSVGIIAWGRRIYHGEREKLDIGDTRIGRKNVSAMDYRACGGCAPL